MATSLLSTARACFFPHTTNKAPKRPLFFKFFSSCMNKFWRCSSSPSSESTGSGHEATKRPRLASHQPNIWSYEFPQALKIDESEAKRVSKLEEEVRAMLDSIDTEVITTLELIDDVQRLGLKSRFEENIKKALARYVSKGSRATVVGSRTSLHATALGFRLLRQYGFDVSQGIIDQIIGLTSMQDVFTMFTDHKRNFKSPLRKDHQGMLSLLEASYLAFEGETLLEEATIFTRNHFKDLNSLAVEKPISQQVRRSLEIPLHRRMQRLEARWYIDTYSEKNEANSSLLDLAKLDFNLVQSLHQEEIQELVRWWKNLGLASRLSFARDGIMECFFAIVGLICNPQFSYCRKELTKSAALIRVIDDIYDVHGTLDELKSFTNSVKRWDVGSVENLPDYMKLCFLALYNTVNEMAYNTLKEQGQNIIPQLTKAWADLCEAFLQEAQWNNNKIRPKLEEYLDNAWISSSGMLLLSQAHFLTAQNLAVQGLDCLRNYHNLDLLHLPSLVFRLCNDLGTSSVEVERGKITNSILCYMNDTGVTKEVACEHIHNLIDETWKKMNKLTFYGTPFGAHFTEIATDLARTSQCYYQHGDGPEAPDSRAEYRVYKLFIEPIS